MDSSMFFNSVKIHIRLNDSIIREEYKKRNKKNPSGKLKAEQDFLLYTFLLLLFIQVASSKSLVNGENTLINSIDCLLDNLE